MKNKKLLAICGKSASGKDTLMKWLVRLQPWRFHKVVNHTTRPRRSNEKEGRDYFYITEDEFLEGLKKDEFMEACVFNDWVYGTKASELRKNKINIAAYVPEGLDALKDRSDVDLVIVLIEAEPNTRMIRSVKREKGPSIREIVRRAAADDKDFYMFSSEFDCIVLKNDSLKDFIKAYFYLTFFSKNLFKKVDKK